MGTVTASRQAAARPWRDLVLLPPPHAPLGVAATPRSLAMLGQEAGSRPLRPVHAAPQWRVL
jgi:hypothetical protein